MRCSASLKGARPRRGWTRQFIPAMRSLIVLMARRATGVSANLRRFAGVGFGSPSDLVPKCVSTDGMAIVRRLSLDPADTISPMRRSAPRILVNMFTVFSATPRWVCCFGPKKSGPSAPQRQGPSLRRPPANTPSKSTRPAKLAGLVKALSPLPGLAIFLRFLTHGLRRGLPSSRRYRGALVRLHVPAAIGGDFISLLPVRNPS